MSAPKTLSIWSAFLRNESAYGAGDAVSGTDAKQLSENFWGQVTLSHRYDGARGQAPSGGGPLRQNTPRGWQAEGPLKTELKGLGAAYGASAFPPDIHHLLLASGHNVTTVTTPGSESQTYTPEPGPTGFDSLCGELYAGGERITINGGYCDLTLEGSDLGAVIATFDLNARVSAVADALPSPIYAQGVIIPPETVGMTFTINGVPMVVRSWKFTVGRARSYRRNQVASDGHAGYTLLFPDPMLEATVEALPLSTLNPYTLRNSNTEFAGALSWGSVQYNRAALNLPTAHLQGLTKGDDDGTALWVMSVKPHVLPAASNGYNLVLN